MKTKRVLFASIALQLSFAFAARAQWVPASTGLPSLNSADQNMGFVALDSRVFVATVSRGLWVSSDNGLSWMSANNGLDTNILTLAASGQNLVAATYRGVYLSQDGGMSWNPTTIPAIENNVSIECSFASIGNTLFAVPSWPGPPVWISHDNGVTWTDSIPMPTGPGPVTALTAVGTDLYLGANDGIWISRDSGKSWNQASGGAPTTSGWILCGSSQGIFAFKGNDIYVSNNRGVNWSKIDQGLPTPASVFGMTASATDVFAATYRGGVYRLDAGGSSWKVIRDGMPDTTQVVHIGVAQNNLYVNSQPVQFGSQTVTVWRRPLSDFSDVSHSDATMTLLELYPNPTTKTVIVRNALHVTLSNMLGFELLDRSNSGGGDMILDLSNLPAGTYMARVTTDGGMVMKKVVKE